MRLINRIRWKYSVLFLIIGLVIGYLAGTSGFNLGNLNFNLNIELPDSREKILDEETMLEKEISKEITGGARGFASVLDSDEERNSIVIFGFEGLETLEKEFYEAWIGELEEDEVIGKISLGKFNIDEKGIIVNSEGLAMETFSQSNSDNDLDIPVNLLDPDREFRIYITTESGKVILGGVIENKITVLSPPRN